MDCSSENVRYLVAELIELRKKAPQEISNVYTRQNEEILKNLKCVKISLQTNEEFNNFNFETSNPFENLHINQDKKQLDKICDQIKLLRILIKKKNCPISKIIDDI